MKIRTTLTTLVISTLLLGCSIDQVAPNHWTIKQGYDNVVYLPLAQISCHEKSKKVFPIKCEVKKISKYDAYINNTGNDSDCNYMMDDRSWEAVDYGEGLGDEGYEHFGRLGIETYLKDINKKNRNDSFYQCMSTSGWNPV